MNFKQKNLTKPSMIALTNLSPGDVFQTEEKHLWMRGEVQLDSTTHVTCMKLSNGRLYELLLSEDVRLVRATMEYELL